MSQSKWWILSLIFIIAIAVRFYAFRDSVYFAFDQARDAYISQEIFVNRDIKLIGPPVSGDVGLFHGPLFWYVLGPIYLLFDGDPAMVSAVFRIFNALGIFLVFQIARNLFSPFVGILSAFFYAISFEQSQYSFYVGNPSLGVITMLIIFYGSVLLQKKTKYSIWSPLLLLGGAALSTQMNLMYAYTFLVVGFLIVLLRKNAVLIQFKYWMTGIGLALFFLISFVLVEVKYNFRSIKLAMNLFMNGFGVMDTNASKYYLFLNKFFRMFRDNIVGLDSLLIIKIIASLIVLWVVFKSLKNMSYQILAVWMFGWVFLMLLGGHNAFYTNVGLSVSILIAASTLIDKIKNYNKFFAVLICGLIVLGNFRLIKLQSPNSLLQEIVTQPVMKLTDEYTLIDQMYNTANGKGFTVRFTGVPYSIQTVWSYLFHFYGEKKYGYLPYWESGNVLGFPGEMPVPKNGTTCLRFLGREPLWGLPEILVKNDKKEEDNFSKVINKISVGGFTLETRLALNSDCHNNRP
jgi:hypothetical protein